MAAKDMVKETEKCGTRMSKAKVLEAINKAKDKDFFFALDSASGYAVFRIPLA